VLGAQFWLILYDMCTDIRFGSVSKTKQNLILNKKIGKKLFYKISFCICI